MTGCFSYCKSAINKKNRENQGQKSRKRHKNRGISPKIAIKLTSAKNNSLLIQNQAVFIVYVIINCFIKLLSQQSLVRPFSLSF